MKSFYVLATGGVILSVRVGPAASRQRFAGLVGDRLVIKVCARAVEGKANQALCNFLSQALKLPKSSVSITRGATSRDKTVFIQGDPEAVLSKLIQELSEGQDT